MRTIAAIRELFAAAKFEARYTPDGDPVTVEMWKGEPPVFMCSEPMPTVHFPEGRAGVKVLGPVCLMAMAWHLRLTNKEAQLANLVPDAAYALLKMRVDEITDEAGIERLPLYPIGPDDPRWGRDEP